MITCDSIEGFPVLKYYEALACNTLLLATPSKELEDLGFIDGKTFAAVNSSNILEKAYYYLNHEEERTKMAHNGYELVREKHSTERRSKELVTFLQDIIQGRRVGTLADY
nr:glycosyltransferase [Peribacillus deserti]